MIAPATPTLREELAAVNWTDNVKPVGPDAERRVLRVHQQEERGRPGRLKPTKRGVCELDDVMLRVFQMFAMGKRTGAVAKVCGVHRMQIVRFRKWMEDEYGVRIRDAHQLPDTTLDGLRAYLLDRKGGAV